jgi:hypothetical protein
MRSGSGTPTLMLTQFVFIYVDKYETHRQKEATVREYLFTAGPICL